MTASPTSILETKRLLLRRLVMDDLNDLFALYRDAEIRRYFPDGVLTLDETREELEWFLHGHPAHPELGLWATIHKETGRFIGRCGLLPWVIEERAEVEIAYLLDRAYWRQGLATEAAQGLLHYCFEQLHLTRVICLMALENQASQRVAQKIGMALEGKVDGIAGDNFPTLIYSINRHA
jgi:[ribosomal protein S5]-alanine N-acetyltransferase